VTRSRLLGSSIVAAVVVPGIAAAILWIVPSSEYLFLPDPARPVDPLVSVPDERQAADPDGAGIYMVDVNVRQARLFERLFPEIHDGATLVPAHVFNPTGEPEKVRRQQSLDEMSASQKVAVAVALRHLGYDVEATGAEVLTVRVGSPADGVIEPGDVVVKTKGKTVHGPQDLFDAMAGHRPGEPVAITVRRNGEARDLRVGTTTAPDDPKRAIMGITVEPSFHFPVNVHINAGNVGGPSAGLAFALDIVDEIRHNLDRGRRIVVTGALSLDGRVSEIGGIEQKTIGAREAGADLFLVPDANAADARTYARGLRIVPVSTFSEALSVLTTGELSLLTTNERKRAEIPNFHPRAGGGLPMMPRWWGPLNVGRSRAMTATSGGPSCARFPVTLRAPRFAPQTAWQHRSSPPSSRGRPSPRPRNSLLG